MDTVYDAPAYLVDLMFDKNPEISRIVNDTLEVIAEFDDEWAKRVQHEKFRHHNQNWLDMVESRQTDDVSDTFGEDEIGRFIQGDEMLNHPDLYYSADGYEGVILHGDGSLSPEFVVDDMMSSRQSYSRFDFEEIERPMNPFAQNPGVRHANNMQEEFFDY